MFRKNVSGQHVCVAAINASTGAALTGATISVRRCLDGTFAAASGTVTEDSGGFYKLALSQADTNGNNVSLFFTATNMVPVSLTFVTTAADPTDSVRFGLTAMPNVASGSAGAIITSGTGTAQLSVSSGLVTLAGVTHTGAVIPTVSAVTGLTAANLDVAVSTRMATYAQPTGFLAATFPGTVASPTNITAASGVTLAAVTHTGAVIPTVSTLTGLTASDVGAIKAKTDNLPASPAAVSDIPTATQNADALLNRDMAAGTDSGSPTVRTVRQALRFLRNKWSISGTTLTVTKEDDSTASWTSTVATTPGADPVTGNDPA
jgi:hypothetical protein